MKSKEMTQAHKMLTDPSLLWEISTEIGKKHVGDVKARMLLFLCCTTAKMEPKNRVSVRICGNSTSGKDNMLTSVLDLFPDDVFARYTGTSDKYLARLVDSKPGLYIGELNLQRKGGANQNIVELLKAASEGGVCYGFLEPSEGGKYVPVENKIERKVVIYSGTEIRQDDELSTRVLSIAVDGSMQQTKNVLMKLAEPEDVDVMQGESWIRKAIGELDTEVRIIIPNGIKEILVKRADYGDVRARRDIKRLFAIIRASAFIHQFQRVRHSDMIYANALDVYHALTALGDTLNQSYVSIEPRLQTVIKEIAQMDERDWHLQSEVAEKCGIRGHNRQVDIFRSLEDQLIIRRRPSFDDRRKYEIQLTGKAPGTFLRGTVEDIFNEVYTFQSGEKTGTIAKNASLDSEKIGWKSFLMVPNASPAIDFVTGKRLEIKTDIGGSIGNDFTNEKNLSGTNQEPILEPDTIENNEIGTKKYKLVR